MRRRIRFDECDEPEEVCGWLNKIRQDQDQMEGKIINLSNTVDAMATKPIPNTKQKPSPKGSTLVKTLVTIVLVIVIASLCHAVYVPTDINYDIASNPELLATYLRDCYANMTANSYLFTPTDTEPTAAEGKVYYNDTSNALMLCVDGTNYLSVDTAGGVGLDSAYDYGSAGGGRSITASDGAVAIANTDADTAFLLTLNAAPSSAAASGGAEVTVGANSTEAAIEIENSGSGSDIEGTAGWTISKAGAIVCVGLQSNAGGDVLFNDTYDISWDASKDQLLIEDNAVLGLGGAHDADGDVTLKWDASNLLVESAAEDTGEMQFGATNAIDVVMYANTNTSEAMFNASTATLEFNGYDVQVMDDDIVAYGDSDEFTTYYDEASTDNLITVAANANDAVQVGDGTTGTDLKMMGATSGDFVLFDASADETYHEDCDLKLNEGAQLEFCGSDNATDWTIDVATAERLTFTPSETDDTSTFHIGTAANTSDVLIYGATASELITWDASADSLTVVADLALYTVTGTTAPFKVDATGTVAGFATILETTDGGIQLNADGAANGDITVDAADILTLTSADIKMHDGATTEIWHIEGTADGSEHIISFTDPTADITWTFPDGGTDILAIMGSTLATNYPEVANSVTGGTNQLIFEGTADGFETILTATDATADATLTLPDDSGNLLFVADGGKTTKDASDAAIPLTDAIVEATSGAASAWSLADGKPGQVLTVVIVTDGGEATITPDTTFTGWATVVLTDDIDSVTFLFADTTTGWIILGTAGDGTNLVAVTQ